MNQKKKLTIDDVKKYIEQVSNYAKKVISKDNMEKIYYSFKGFKIFLDKKLYEDNFDYSKMPRFKRGDIIYVDLGQTIGSELYKIRPVVVIENDNKKSERTIIIAPIKTSNKKGLKTNVDGLVKIGDLSELDDESYVDLKQIRTISKMRIKRLEEIKYLREQGYKGYKLTKLKNEQLDEIDMQIIKIFLKKGKIPEVDIEE
ncbi:growth inhibitor (plasmid) [Marinitoga piezophila KA3]|uniref:Growth inhibitor n=1 Tax=Marinitoga piezophila (strain DSM 14283 / JCM 11233 / KA3) TaxID=443254 RepID=H2J8G0_MARPK|nr:type II toxin-antitoxin system PemK/MazF family toxin [Marinitoga piezophila]AEX86504.1 growth inhibitor [Marinitoga piezophila KA3]